jgi:predicted Zn-dependent protease
MKEWNTLRVVAIAATLSVAGTLSAQSAPQNGSTPQQPASSQDSTNASAPSPTQTDPNASAPATTQTDSAQSDTSNSAPSASSDNNKDKDKDKKKPGKKDDVDEIGNRDIGGRGLGNWYSIDKEVRVGKQYAQQVEQTVKLVNDPVVNEYVNRVGQNIVRNSDCKVPFTIKVVDDDSINAFALPGGFFYVNSGLILAADNESEMAGVMAHETAHVCAHHAMRQMTRAQYANFASLPLIFMGGGIGYAAYEAAGLGLPLTFMKFSRNFEAEADYLGVQYMYKTGYDPQSFVDFFEKIQAQEKKKPGSLAKAFASHPQTPDRIERSQAEIAKILPSKPQYIVTTSEFDSVKSRLASIENKRKLRDDKDSGRPTLRRASTDQDKSKSGDNTNGDDRPTLHRRDQ